MQAIRETEELRRIVALPRRAPRLHPDVVRELSELLRTPTGTMQLRPLQALALHDIGVCGGGFLPLDVGEGKTLISLLAAYVLDAKRPLLLLPAHLIGKTARERAELASHWLIPTNVRLMSYQMLGLVQSAAELDVYAPDLFILDESQKAKSFDAAVTKRIDRYMTKHPETRMVAMTGTIMRKSLRDFAHIVRWCLKDGAPVPAKDAEVDEWALALDEKVDNEFQRREPGALLALADHPPADVGDPLTRARRGFRRRLRETPGVVCSAEGGTQVEAGLMIRALRYEVSQVTVEHFRRLRTEWCTPDGWELMEAVDVWRHARELALGFHQVWTEKETWETWLAPILASAKNRTADIVRKIANDLRHMIESARSGAIPQNGASTFSSAGTGYKTENTNFFSLFRAECARYASALRADERSTRSSQSTMITRPASFADYFAPDVITLSVSSENGRAWSELFSICLEASRPPKPWRDARSAWAKFVRETLARSRTFDSPLQVELAVGHVELHKKFPRLAEGVEPLAAWKAVRDTFTPNPVPVWHDESALRVAAKWMKKPGIVWTEHVAFASRLAAMTGAKYYGAKGLAADGSFVDDGDPNAAIIVSVDANREGRNLQRKWHRNLITSPEEGADKWQQLLGRTHRPGQEDDVAADVFLGCAEHSRAWTKALAGAESIRDTVGSESKLLIADIDWPDEDEIASWAGPRWER